VKPAFSIVVVCTGNRFRSPLAEHLLRREVDGLPVSVSSVGTMQLASGPALPEAVELARDFGLDLSEHRSRTLSRELVEDADLVLGFERRHVKAAVVDGRAARERTFTIGELAALLRAVQPSADEDPGARARAAVAEADSLRDRLRDPGSLEIHDPFGREPDVYRRSAESVRDLVEEIASRLFGR
jgi:protein-tyrosine phosphatase